MPRYFILTLIVFWIPNVVLFLITHDRLDPLTRRAFWITQLLMLPVTIVMEYVYLKTGIWTFSEALDPLLGVRIFGAPIEEFSFWFGGTPFMLLVYLTLSHWKPRRH